MPMFVVIICGGLLLLLLLSGTLRNYPEISASFVKNGNEY